MSSAQSSKPWKILVHGGAGAIQPDRFSPEEKQTYLNGLEQAAQLGAEALLQGATALQAATIAVRDLEDNPLFNAGRGAVYHSQGGHELDASVMCGLQQKGAGVSGLTRVKNPVELALILLEKGSHSLLAGGGAESFADRWPQLKRVPPEHFNTDLRKRQYQEFLQKGQMSLDHGGQTVGAVALDLLGNLAAATSTGGLTGKLPGRVSDSAIVGAGTYADNQTCALSATGTGDVFIQRNSCFYTHLLVKSGASLSEACQTSLDDLKAHGGSGGLIAINARGNSAMLFNTQGMFRAQMGWDSPLQAEIV